MQVYSESLTACKRLRTREVKVGELLLGAGHPIRVQTMTTTDTMDTMATVEQSIRCIEAGAELIRITAPSKNEAENLQNIKDELKNDFGFTYIFISHDLAVVKYMSDQLLVMNKGKIEELGDADEIYENPQTEYSKKLIEARYKQRYSFSTGEIAISIKKSRSITVSVFGEVRNPGSFTSSAANTAYNLIVLAKGISDLGSVRNIQIVSPGGGIKIYDVYKSMMNPTLATNIYLQNNDFVQVPVAQKVVSVIGAVVRPYRYELLPTENLGDLIKYAGGYAADADKELIQIIRFENGSRKIYEVSAANAKTFIPQNGDEITVIQSSEEVKNKLEVSGEVERPGDFEWKTGMKVTDLLDKARLKRTTKRNIGFVQSLNSDNSYSLRSFNIDSISEDKNSPKNYLLSPNDKLIILSQIDFTQYYKINVSGAVRNPGEFDFDPAKNITVQDAVTLAGGLKVDALSKAYVVRTDTATGIRNYALFNIQNALTDINSSDNFIMEPLDRIVILSNSIIKNESTVSVGGAVKNPGQFKYGYSMTLLDAITLSGGLKTEAATNRVEIFRIVLNNNEPTKVVAATFDIPRDLIMATDALNKTYLEPFDIIEVRSLPKYSLQKMIKIEGEVRYPGSYALIKDNETIYEIIGRAGGLNPEAFIGGAKLNRSFDNIGLVIIQLGDIMKNPNASYNISLSDGDVLTIPKNKELVSIEGAVNIGDITNAAELNNDYKINVAYMSGRNVKYYIDEFAGGLSDKADKSKRCPIHLVIRQKDVQIKVSTGEKVFKKDWDNSNQLVLDSEYNFKSGFCCFTR